MYIQVLEMYLLVHIFLVYFTNLNVKNSEHYRKYGKRKKK